MKEILSPAFPCAHSVDDIVRPIHLHTLLSHSAQRFAAKNSLRFVFVRYFFIIASLFDTCNLIFFSPPNACHRRRHRRRCRLAIASLCVIFWMCIPIPVRTRNGYFTMKSSKTKYLSTHISILKKNTNGNDAQKKNTFGFVHTVRLRHYGIRSPRCAADRSGSFK